MFDSGLSELMMLGVLLPALLGFGAGAWEEVKQEIAESEGEIGDAVAHLLLVLASFALSWQILAMA
jgi:hypothetical protein